MDNKISKLTHTEKLLYIGLILNANDYGCFRYSYAEIKGKIFTFDIDINEGSVQSMIDKFISLGLLKNSNDIYYFPKWFEYQSIRYLEKTLFDIPKEVLEKCPEGIKRYNWRELKQTKEIKNIEAKPPTRKHKPDKSLDFITYWKKIGLKGCLTLQSLDASLSIKGIGRKSFKEHINNLLAREPYKSSWKQILFCLRNNKWFMGIDNPEKHAHWHGSIEYLLKNEHQGVNVWNEYHEILKDNKDYPNEESNI